MDALTLPQPYGVCVDRTAPVTFSFESKTLEGYSGDTIASALARNGVRIISRSFKYHRPRGIFSLNGLDANLLVSVNGVPNVDAGSAPLEAAMQVRAQNCWGPLAYDLKSSFGLLRPLLGVGFYYRHFFRPHHAWGRFWEPFFRRQAGLGRVDLQAPLRVCTKRHEFYEVVVVGGGPAGIVAAIEAGRRGHRTLLIDRNAALGGALNYARTSPQKDADTVVRRALLRDLASCDAVTVWTGATCTGWFADNWLAVVRGSTLYKIRAARTIFAPGAYGKPLIFRNNDLPGVMLGSTAQRLIELYAVRPGSRAIVVADGAAGHGVALSLSDAGISVGAVLAVSDRASLASPLVAELKVRNIPVLKNATITEAVPRFGNKGIKAVRFTTASTSGLQHAQLPCDLLCVSAGEVGAWHLSQQALGTLPANATVAEAPATIGAAASATTLDEVRAHVAAVFGGPMHAARSARTTLPIAEADAIAPAVVAAGTDFVDFDEDVTVADVRDTLAIGYTEIELTKRFTTIGMGPSQGRHSGDVLMRLNAALTGRRAASVGVTTARPPVFPEALGHLAGARLQRDKLTPIHHRHLESNAQMISAGDWHRPAYFAREPNREDSVEREILAVRSGVGVLDLSPLGKLEIRGAQAAVLLDRLYTLSYSTMRVGQTRYLLMLDDAGYIIDDGAAYREGEDLFYVTSTTSAVERTYRLMLRRVAEWRLDVSVTNVTDTFAAINVAGPHARALLERLEGNVDLGAAAFPYLAGVTGILGDTEVRILRIGFLGELGYEIHCPADCGEYLWDAILTADAGLGVERVGMYALRTLRLEKGHIIIGQDTDALTWPDEARMQWALSKKKLTYVGCRSIALKRRQPLERTLIQFALPADGVLPEESSLIVHGDVVEGFVTSIARSRACGMIIGMGYVHPERAGAGQPVRIQLPTGTSVLGHVLAEAPYDPRNDRQKL